MPLPPIQWVCCHRQTQMLEYTKELEMSDDELKRVQAIADALLDSYQNGVNEGLEFGKTERERLREENTRLRRLVKTAYAEGCYDNTETEKTQDELEALWQESFAYKVILDGGNNG